MRARAILVFVAALSSTTVAAQARMHVVRPGESLGLLALRYGVSESALRAWNNLRGDTIRVGQELELERDAAIRHRVVPGDTLSCIAQRYGASSVRIQADNPALAAHGLAVGMTLRIRAGREAPQGRDGRIVHRVGRGENLARIARRYGVRAAQIVQWNPRVSAAALRVGQELAIHGSMPSESLGQPSCGSLRGAAMLGSHPAYVIRDRSRAWGTERTIAHVRDGFDALRSTYPSAPRVRVHDLSRQNGGPIDDHRSHQSGRDVDITYYQLRGCGRQGCPLRVIAPAELDARHEWALLSHWLRRREVEVIFVDYSLQEPLYREARRRGATAEQLARWFQYPHGRNASLGVIRHFPNHANHVHVRFACHPSAHGCR